MTAFVVAAIAMLLAMVPASVPVIRGTAADAVVGYEFVTTVAVMVLALLAEGFGRPGLFELPVLLAVLAYGSGLVYVRALAYARLHYVTPAAVVAPVLVALAISVRQGLDENTPRAVPRRLAYPPSAHFAPLLRTSWIVVHPLGCSTIHDLRVPGSPR